MTSLGKYSQSPSAFLKSWIQVTIQLMKMDFQVSVIIPTYNRAAVLGRAIDSVLAQTLPVSEIIVVDDGSGDDTQALLRRAYPQCRVICQPNLGISAARNRGIAAARNEWLAFLDSDDEWLPGKLEAQWAALQASPECRLCHAEEIWIRNGKRVNAMNKHAKTGGSIYQRCLPLCVISPSAAIIHRDVFRDYGGFDESLPACEDYDLWLRICARESVAFVPTPQIQKYGGHDDQLSRRYWGMDRFRIVALEKILEEGCLSPEDEKATLKTIIEKSSILSSGARKRDAAERAALYDSKHEHYTKCLYALEHPDA